MAHVEYKFVAGAARSLAFVGQGEDTAYITSGKRRSRSVYL